MAVRFMPVLVCEHCGERLALQISPDTYQPLIIELTQQHLGNRVVLRHGRCPGATIWYIRMRRQAVYKSAS